MKALNPLLLSLGIFSLPSFELYRLLYTLEDLFVKSRLENEERDRIRSKEFQMRLMFLKLEKVRNRRKNKGIFIILPLPLWNKKSENVPSAYWVVYYSLSF